MISGHSIPIAHDPIVDYVLRIGDTALVHAQRLAEWCGHAPVLEEDIALSNVALDHIGQARALLTHAGSLHASRAGGQAYDEDQLAFLRGEGDFRNVTLAELPLRRGGGDFADTVVRNLLLSTWFKLWWQRLQSSADETLAGISGKALKEARYHQSHAAQWVVRLGDGTDESAARMRKALARAWPYVPELFEADAVDAAAVASGIGPATSDLHPQWSTEIAAVLKDANLTAPAATAFRSTGRRGVHSEHLGYLLAEMQVLQRSYPGGAW